MSFANFKKDVIKYFEKFWYNTFNWVSVNSFNEKSFPLNNFCSNSSISLEVLVEAVAEAVAEVEAEAELEGCTNFFEKKKNISNAEKTIYKLNKIKQIKKKQYLNAKILK